MHFVEGAGQLAELPRGIDRQRGCEVSGGHLAHGLLDARHPLRHQLREVEADAEREHQRDQGPDQDLMLAGRVPFDDRDVEEDDSPGPRTDRQRGRGDHAPEWSDANVLHSWNR
jgi:hypothetical protein